MQVYVINEIVFNGVDTWRTIAFIFRDKEVAKARAEALNKAELANRGGDSDYGVEYDLEEHDLI